MNLRLLLFAACNRACEGCCNKQWDLEALPVCESYDGYDMIMLTGGEPMLRPGLVCETVAQIRAQSDARIILYTARVVGLADIAPLLDGITLTLHEQADVRPFEALELPPRSWRTAIKSLRLNVFAGVNISGVDTAGWQVKAGIEWIEDCPLPEDEVFMRLH